jgi:hypothetical protein
MNRAKVLGLLAAAFLLGWLPSAHAQDALKIEVFAGNYRSWDPVRVHVRNISNTGITLVIPVNIDTKNERTTFSLPLDVERMEGDEWKLCWPVRGARRGYSSLDIQPGDSRVYTFGIASDGRFRARVWYLADPGDLGPPKRLPVFESVVSEPFDVLPHEFIPAAAQPAMAALAKSLPRLCGTLVPWK